MLCFLDNLPNFTLVLWVLSLEMSCTPDSKLYCSGWAVILILGNIHVALNKVSLFSGNQNFMSGDHFVILDRRKATLKNVKPGALHQ